MPVTFSQIPTHLMMSAPNHETLKVFHVVYTQTLGRAGWDFSYQQLADEAGCSRRTAMRAVEWLGEHGWLVKVSGGERKPNRFEVHQTPASVPSDTRPSVPSDTSSSVQRDTHQERVTRRESPGEESQHLSITADAATTFDTFWSVYPRRVGKRTAHAAYERATKRADASVICAGAAKYRDDPNREPEFTAHPTTWLNRDGWDDDPLPRRLPVSRVESAGAVAARLANLPNPYDPRKALR